MAKDDIRIWRVMGWTISFTPIARRKGAKLPESITVTYHEEFGWKVGGGIYDLKNLGPELRLWLQDLNPLHPDFSANSVRDLVLAVFNPMRIRLTKSDLVLQSTFDQVREMQPSGGHRVIQDLGMPRNPKVRRGWD